MTDRAARQAIYERIREFSKDEVILEEMVRLGFLAFGKPTTANPISQNN
jgi:hypothetical protein